MVGFEEAMAVVTAAKGMRCGRGVRVVRRDSMRPSFSGRGGADNVEKYRCKTAVDVGRRTRRPRERNLGGGRGALSVVRVSDESVTPERPEEKFMVVQSGEADCTNCGYHYDPKLGDDAYPVGRGTTFTDLPGDWTCPLCGANKTQFTSVSKELAGFAENQTYGFGTNTMTAGQKSGLIYGSLLFFFALFLSGYLLG